MRSSWAMFRVLMLPWGNLITVSTNVSSGQQNASQGVGQQNTTVACDERLMGFRGNGYRGCQTLTREGRTCMKWTAQSPHRHYSTPLNFPGKGLGDHNYCRNPDYQTTIWCYTTDPNKQWEYCSPVQQVTQQNAATAACAALTTPYSCMGLNFCIWDLRNASCQAQYELIMNGSCVNHITGGLAACSSAAAMLNLSNITAIFDGQASVGYDPPYCYFEGGVLKYNNGGSNTGSCNSIDQCLCANGQTTTTTTMMTVPASATQVSSTSSEASTTDGIAVAAVVGGVASLCVLVLCVVCVCRIMRRPKSDQEPNMLDPESNLPEASAPPTESGCPNGVPSVMDDAGASTLLDADSGGAQVEDAAQVCQKPQACRPTIQIKLRKIPRVPQGQALLEAVDALGCQDAWGDDKFSKQETRPTQTFDDGAAYTGDWLNNLKHGHGLLVWPDGIEYNGEWEQDKAHGKGRFVGFDGDVYEGTWLGNGANGFGSYKHATNGSKYEGQWADGRQHGEGTETWPDGSKYQGQWVKGRKQGTGIFSWTDKSRFEGQFHDNDIHGDGVYEWSDGRKYEGQWKSNQMHGIGKFRWPDGRLYEGSYANDQMDGRGTFKWPDGRTYTGKWKKGKQDAAGDHTPSPRTPRTPTVRMPRVLRTPRAPHTPRSAASGPRICSMARSPRTPVNDIIVP